MQILILMVLNSEDVMSNIISEDVNANPIGLDSPPSKAWEIQVTPLKRDIILGNFKMKAWILPMSLLVVLISYIVWQKYI